MLKWVKTNQNRSFPEEEDASAIYAARTASTSEAAGTSVNNNSSGDVVMVDGAAPSAATTVGAAGAASGAPSASQGESVTAPAAPAVVTAPEGAVEDGVGDETQGQHLFDETQMPGEITTPSGRVSGEGTPAGNVLAAEDVSMAGPGEVGGPEATATAKTIEGDSGAAVAAEAEAEAEDAEEQEEDEDQAAAPVKADKHTTIRIGGPVPEGAELPEEASEATKADVNTTTAVAREESATEEKTEPTPQVASELHPPPDGVPPSNPLAEQSAASAPSADAPEAAKDQQQPPQSEGIEVDPKGEADALGGVETTTRDDPEVQQAAQDPDAGDVVAVVHAEPDGVERVKVVND